ncbi:MAG: hypothetical protein Tsb0013_06910 [Phycisphaerales bacterium]
MTDLLSSLTPLTTLAADVASSYTGSKDAIPSTGGSQLMALVPLLAILGAIASGLMLCFRVKTKLPAWGVVVTLGAAFVVTLLGFLNWNGDSAHLVDGFRWINTAWGDDPGQSFVANFSFYMDGLSWLWMLFVTGLGALIALYASEYMAHDVGKGYGRFFAAFGLFVFSMACLVMGDNLVLLYLGWEGVGLCSYLLIGYFYQKPEAVAAAKKAFIVNRIGDLGLALGIFLTFISFGTVEYAELFPLISDGQAVNTAGDPVTGWVTWAIPCLLMLGAFGKSAQFPLYVWLPDAMEGPTPVSALIHAATMVTAGVYLIARMFPMFTLHDGAMIALQVVGYVGMVTALLAATIGMAQFDIKRIMAYSTVSQLGYMFAGLGVLTTTGAAFHVFTHAFFKATLFLACGAVMHGFAGQLDLRKLSGLWSQPGWRIVSIAMLIGCLNLAGVPFTAGYFSKDMILAEAFVTPWGQLIGWVLLITAGLTAYYTFRVFFRVFVGPAHYEPGDDHHDAEAEHMLHEEEETHGHGHFHPHPPGWAINTVLTLLSVACLVAAAAYFVKPDAGKGWVGGLLDDSSAAYVSDFGHHGDAHDDGHAMTIGDATLIPARHPGHGGADGHTHDDDHAKHEAGTFLGFDPHKVMYYVSAVFGLIGILTAAYLHGPKGPAGLFIGNRTEAARSRADGLLKFMGPIPKWAQHKWYVDEFYNAVIRLPLLTASHIFHLIDKALVDGVVNLTGNLPRTIAKSIRPTQSGVLQGYAAGMAVGLAVILLIVWVLVIRAGAAGGVG